jgi:hypothetical protein
MTGEDARKLHMIRIGDVIEYRSNGADEHGADEHGAVCGWTSTHTDEPMVLVRGGHSGGDKRVPLHCITSRERPGATPVRFE